ncbi:aldolase/citrate lyase family protein [Ruminococcus sp. OA3]|uniref:HpcH/HpaI aldolase family protein n=1 Tax=Ruminococcus sp. OA3 TaxID=2914164 RepID=UPI001F0597BD|nr:aldolase/citrate lyase family protein [Ruminococcus sp. OA3]MCH1982386.1 aldolase/citrate lyase family protein [Ruminococcus sp. OA3]
MDRYQRLDEKCNNREKICATTISMLNEICLVQKMTHHQMDFLVFDMEHGRFNTETLPEILNACRKEEIPSIVRIQNPEYYLVSKVIDMGADGVLIPRVETVEQVETVVNASYFAPVGKKGFGYFNQFRKNESIYEFKRLIFLQIESPEGIKNLSEILDRFGDYISGILVGPCDLSIMIGTPLVLRSDEMNKAVKTIFDICHEKRKSVGIFCQDARDARKYYEQGANLLWTSMEMNIFETAYNNLFDELEKIR